MKERRKRRWANREKGLKLSAILCHLLKGLNADTSETNVLEMDTNGDRSVTHRNKNIQQ